MSSSVRFAWTIIAIIMVFIAVVAFNDDVPLWQIAFFLALIGAIAWFR